MASHAAQYILGQRILDKELGIHMGEPNEMYSDNLVTLQGTDDAAVSLGEARAAAASLH